MSRGRMTKRFWFELTATIFMVLLMLAGSLYVRSQPRSECPSLRQLIKPECWYTTDAQGRLLVECPRPAKGVECSLSCRSLDKQTHVIEVLGER